MAAIEEFILCNKNSATITQVTAENPHLGPMTSPVTVLWSVSHPTHQAFHPIRELLVTSLRHAAIAPMGIPYLADWYFGQQGRNFLLGSSLILLCSTTKVFDGFNHRLLPSSCGGKQEQRWQCGSQKFMFFGSSIVYTCRVSTQISVFFFNYTFYLDYWIVRFAKAFSFILSLS